ncbi:hypothetical protein [Hydrogenophaga sp.]|uniref:hypothetical protein n=1 Tax=Hydrogenophaga sp. TaxID=1904254 RepID=UPI003AF9815C
MNIRDIRVQKLFAIALVLKVLSSGLGWYLQSPWILGFGVPICIMVVYIWLGLFRRDSDVSDDKFADSAYYLGFIFTITSIIFSLFDLPNIGAKIQDIAVRFGAAMVSTVLGLGIRVYLVSFRVDVSDAIRDAEDTLLGATRAFTERLTMALERLQDFESRVDLATRSSIERVNLQVEALSKNHADKLTGFFSDLTNRNQEGFTKALDEVREASSRLATSVDGYASGMRGHLGSIEVRVDDFAHAVSTRLQKTTFPDDYFAKRLAAPLNQLESAAGEIALKVVSAGAEMSKTAEALSSSLVSVQHKSADAETAMDSILRLSGQQHLVLETAQGQLNALVQLSSKLESFDALLTSMVAELRVGHETSSTLSSHVSKLVGETADSREVVARNILLLTEQLSVQTSASTALASRMDAVVSATDRVVEQLGTSAAAQISASSLLQSSASLAGEAAAKYGVSVEAERVTSRALEMLTDRADLTFTKVNELVQSMHEFVKQVGPLTNGHLAHAEGQHLNTWQSQTTRFEGQISTAPSPIASLSTNGGTLLAAPRAPLGQSGSSPEISDSASSTWAPASAPDTSMPEKAPSTGGANGQAQATKTNQLEG